MDSREKCEQLADKIREALCKELTLNDDVVHFIDSTFSIPTIEELKDILQDDANCEKDTLIELLVFPEESMQIQLEDQLEVSCFERQDESTILAIIDQKPLQMVLRFPGQRGSLHLDIPEFALRQFISRLLVSKQLPEKLIEIIGQRADPENWNQLKVKIRNARFLPTENKINFLCTFIENLDTRSHDFMKCLDFALVFLDELANDGDIYQALMAKKKFYYLNLQKAKQLETMLQRHNIETLLLQGKRVVFIDPSEAQANMQIIDRISRAVFGETEYFEFFQGADDLIEISSAEDIRDMIKSIS
jgi:hypothetical protein